MSHQKKNIGGSLLLLAGGEHGKKGKADPIVSEFIKSLKLNAPRIAYIGAASDNNAYYYSIVKEMLSASGAGEVFIAEFNKKLKYGNNLQKADILFISGGDVKYGIDCLLKNHAAESIIELSENGMPVIGVSAGSIMMCRQWVDWSEPDDSSTAALFPCLGLTDFICDTHDEGDGWEELKTALSLSKDGVLGYGIPTDGALLVDSNGLICACRRSINIFQNKNEKVCRLDDLKLCPPQ